MVFFLSRRCIQSVIHSIYIQDLSSRTRLHDSDIVQPHKRPRQHGLHHGCAQQIGSNGSKRIRSDRDLLIRSIEPRNENAALLRRRSYPLTSRDHATEIKTFEIECEALGICVVYRDGRSTAYQLGIDRRGGDDIGRGVGDDAGCSGGAAHEGECIVEEALVGAD